MPVTVSARAAKRIAAILAGEGGGAMLRLAVTGGGCSGFQYNFALDETRMDEDLLHRGRRRQDPDRPGVAGFPGRGGDRFHRRPDRPGLQGQQSQRHRLLRLRHQLLGLNEDRDLERQFHQGRGWMPRWPG